MTVFAHSRPGRPEEEWEPLVDHARRVAGRAEEFCTGFAPGFGQALGLLHDLGKYQPEFQKYLKENSEAYDEGSGATGRAPHAIVGAAWVCHHSRALGLLLAWPIAAHHGALKNRTDLKAQVERSGPRVDAAQRGGMLDNHPKECFPREMPAWSKDQKVAALGIRMLFSALIDADMLESEAWDKGFQRPITRAPLASLLEALEKNITCKQERDQTRQGHAAELAKLRAKVSDACWNAADEAPGRFRLTVPTGGGKTLSGLRFALRHAIQHGLARIIVVIPYTSILEQTVQVYRKVFDEVDPAAVIEHHSSLDPDNESQQNRWACENWDAPIVVTTSVQFFETLYANHKRPCRKLHRIANSVVLLDEVQTFPQEMLDPIQQALRNLTTYFGSSVVSMTATQPLLPETGAEREIVPDPAGLYAIVRNRFELEWLGDPTVPVEWSTVIARARSEERVLLIVHSRKDAELLARELGPDCIHLSARMCAAHRLDVIEDIKKRLKEAGPIRVVATQLVEAGVDIDFPVVMRAFAGMETLAQAAGRCNREFGPTPGRFVVFRAPTKPPACSLQAGLNAAEQFYREQRFDLNDPEIFPLYTKRALTARETDRGNVLGSERQLDFPESAKNFRMIDNAGVTVVVPYAGGWERVQRLRFEGPTRDGLRRIQRYTVTVYQQELRRLQAEGFLQPLFALHEGDRAPEEETVWVLRGDVQPCPYSERFGLSWQALEEEPSTLMA